MPDLQSTLADCAPIYEMPGDDLVREVLIPGLANASLVRIGAGFFTSGALAQISPGLATLLQRPEARLQLLMGPTLSPDDHEAVRAGLNAGSVLDEVVVTRLMEASRQGSALDRHCLDCLSYLVQSNRLEIRFVFMRQGLYHKKLWLLTDDSVTAAVHGSGNATARGLLVNGEQMTIDRPWTDGAASRQRVAALADSYDRQWQGLDQTSHTVTATRALTFLEQWHGDQEAASVPTVDDFFQAWSEDFRAGIEPIAPKEPDRRRILRVPQGLEFRSGPYEHQGRAVDRLRAAGGGIASIATGGGKTKTALITVTGFQDSSPGANLVFVVVPSRPLIDQWKDEIRGFGVEPILLSDLSPADRDREFDYLESEVQAGRTDTTVMLCSITLFARYDGFHHRLGRLAPFCTITLVADEVHNFGAPNALAALSPEIRPRIGLSATPVRQYDPEGTSRLRDYFGDEVFEFSVADAISSECLVPYSYIPHVVPFELDEAEEFEALSDRIRQLGFLSDFEDEFRGGGGNQLESLLRRRRAVVEQARGKLSLLEDLLSQRTNEIQHALFYCSAKGPVLDHGRQIDAVNALLMEQGILFHQLTNQETASGRAEDLLRRFGRGELKALTAMKVLDEGLDVPQTETAFILASSSVRREWVQRRGRVLRKAPGKSAAVIHDFVVGPKGLGPQAGKSLLRSEVARVSAFGKDSTNQYRADGSAAVIRDLEDLVYWE